ncbi:YheC/YheD family protein [Oceanobacillus oncorhynchi]|uniref:YheC/YheD family protein n=1 Tax=Oceanobacillus oncorhynchi TaxID=545501 RepID=UPI002F96191D
MYICYMRNFINPPEYIKLLVKSAKYYNVDVIFSHPKNVDLDNEVIHGLTLKNNEWHDIDIPIPEYIDLNSYCYKYKNVITFLRKKSTLLNPKGFGSKQKIYNTLIKDGEFAKYVPATTQISDFDSLVDFMEEHNKVVLKPSVGHKGIGIYLINKVDQKSYKLYTSNSEKTLSLNELQISVENLIKDKVYLAQQYIHSVTTREEPFDCRIRLEKNGEGEWRAAIYLIRIGSNDKVVSNVAQGGSVQELVPFLKYQYPNTWTTIKNEIEYIATRIPKRIEELYCKQTSCLGIDIGIDKDESIYLFEINAAPGVKFGEAEIINLKVDYYNYLNKKN